MLNEAYSTDGLDSLEFAQPYQKVELNLPSLEELLKQQRSLPAYSLMLGMCEDGLPLVLDLTDSISGSFLIAGDSGFDNTTLLHGILTAAFKANTEEEVNLHLISPHADDLLYFHRQPSFKISYEPFRPECEVVLEEMVNLVLQRQRSDDFQPIHLLAIDSLDLLWQSISSKARMWLEWLVEWGPRAGLWVFASLESTYIDKSLASIIQNFPSRILGRISQANLARYLSGLSRSYLTDLKPGQQFFVRTGGQSFKIWMLMSEDIYE